MPGPHVHSLTPTFSVTTPVARRLLEEAGARFTQADEMALPERETLRELLADVVGLIVGTQPIDRSLLELAPQLRVIAKHGAGVDNIDVDAATERGIFVTNAPGCNAMAVAEFTFGLMIAVARRIAAQDARVREGRWGIHVGRELAGSTLGIVGMGRVGRLVAARARAFDMRIVYTDAAEMTDLGDLADACAFVPLDDLLATADFVTLHAPLTPQTHHLIDAAALRRMKPTAFLVNAARGEIVDQQALETALVEGQIAGAALDVFAEEPLRSETLIAARDQTVLTPHTAGYTSAALDATSILTAENVVDALQGRVPRSALNRPAALRR